MTDVLTRIATIDRVRIDDEHIVAVLSDGREVGIPLVWSPRLGGATREERANYEIQDFGTCIYWPDLDEDIDLAAFLGVSENVIYDALGWKKPTRTTKEYLRAAGED